MKAQANLVKFCMAVLSPHWHMRNRLFEREIAAVPPGGYVFLGDSLTEAFDLPKYFPAWPAVNRGISGDHIDGLLQRLDTSALALNPARVFLMIGINDIADGRDNLYLLRLYKELLTRLVNETTAVIYLQSLLPTGPEISQCPPGQITGLNSTLKKYADERGIRFVDLYSHFSHHPPWIDRRITVDGLHLNENGYTRWAAVLKRTLAD